ncbi:MAG: PAS domain S-box-containing protein [Flavobacteriales bacterium]
MHVPKRIPIRLTVTQAESGGVKFFTGVIEDISDQIENEKKLLEKDALIQAAIKSSNQPFLIASLDGKFVDVNLACCTWLGYSLDQMLNLTLDEIVDDVDGGFTRKTLNKLSSNLVSRFFKELLFVCNDGTRIWGYLSMSLVADSEGNASVFTIQITDVQLYKDLEEVLESRNRDLEKSNSDLDQFAYVASHDLKSPLNAISKIVSWIEEDCGEILPESSKGHLNLLRNRTQRMLKLLNDLLDYSRVGRREYQEEVFSLKEISEDVFELLDTPDSFTFKCTAVDVRLPITPFELVLRNLMSNAIKHHDRENGNIILSAARGEDKYYFRVEDDGPGIPDSMHEKAMEMFQTLKPRDQVEGSGMGLAMVKKTVEHYGGSIHVESSAGRGCTIVVCWPLPIIEKSDYES